MEPRSRSAARHATSLLSPASSRTSLSIHLVVNHARIPNSSSDGETENLSRRKTNQVELTSGVILRKAKSLNLENE